MSDREPTEQFEYDEPAEPTRVVSPPPPPPPVRSTNRALWGVLAALVVLVVILLVAFIAGGDDDDDDTVATDVTVTMPEVTTTRPAVATTKPAVVVTTAAPTPTIAPARCTPETDPAKPALPAMTLYDAWRIGDRDCASTVATGSAVNTLFKLQPNGPEWDFQGCTEVDEPDPYTDCAFTYEGGSTHFRMVYNPNAGWSIYEVEQVAD